MQLTDSRRLTGANLLLDGPGAAAELEIDAARKEQAVKLWQTHIRAVLTAVGWETEQTATRYYDGGVTFAITAPIDALYAATDVVEAAWELAGTEISGGPKPEFDGIISKLQAEIDDEVTPDLLTLAEAADSRGIMMLSDDEWISLGLGKTAKIWPRDEIPAPEGVTWNDIANVPTALVTGTNGKSTTVRVSAAICMAAGKTPGFSSSDWVRAGKEIIASGDYSGPEGARLALRDKRVDMAIIETARGGLLRRGLPIPRADACLITNVASDHLGDYGIKDVPALADVKFILSKAVATQGQLILNADDPLLRERAKNFDGNLSWYGLSITKDKLADWKTPGNEVAFLDGGVMCLARGDEIISILPAADFPPALGGAALYNISNALGAIALTSALGIATDDMAAPLQSFESSPEENPGRGNFMNISGVKVLVDFAHNPHGISALVKTVQNVPAKRRAFLLGQAGDRTDDNIRAMTRAVSGSNPDLIVIKELMQYLRGRKAGDVPALIRDELKIQDYPENQIRNTDCEMDAVRESLSWAQSGDLLVFLVYQERDEVLAFLSELAAKNWQPGDDF